MHTNYKLNILKENISKGSTFIHEYVSNCAIEKFQSDRIQKKLTLLIVCALRYYTCIRIVIYNNLQSMIRLRTLNFYRIVYF